MDILNIEHADVFRGEQQALFDLSLRLPEGQHHAILGPNGAGKSTLLKLITRELSPVVRDGSRVEIFGSERVNIWALRQKIGLVSQDLQEHYLSLATGKEVVLSAFFGSVGLHEHHHVNDAQLARADEVLADLGLESLAERRYLQLSTGQQRRLLLARALAHRPEVLILDEPTNSLDIQARFWFARRLRALAQAGTTLILVTHDPHDIIPEIEHVSLLKQGRLFASGLKSEVFSAETFTALFETPVACREHGGFYQLTPA